MSLLSILSSYWWIFLLAIVILAVITRSIIKLVVGTIILVVVIFILLWLADLMLGSSIKGLSACYRAASETSLLTVEKMKKNMPGVEEFCRNDKQELNTLSSCFQRVEKSSPVSVETLQKLAKLINPQAELSFETYVQEHNDLCLAYPDTLMEN